MALAFALALWHVERMPSFHDFDARTIDGQERPLSDYAGQVLLVVNVASRCGLTPHYAGLQSLHDHYRARGFQVLGFPCNQFGGQEPGDEAAIQSFCSTTYGVEFPMFSKIEVNGDGRHPAWAWLTAQETTPDGAGDVAWNFAKFIVGRDGTLQARFGPATEPEAPELRAAIEQAL